MVDIEVDSDFNIHTSYHSDFFLLRTKVLVNGENATIKPVKEGSYEEPVMSFSHGGSTISTKLWLIANSISPILHKCGIYHVDTFYYEQSPLFHVVFSSESCLKKFLQEIGDVNHLMEVELLSILSKYLKTESPQLLTTIVQLDLFLVSPNRPEAGEAEVHQVTAENCSAFATHWKDSKLFNFASLHWEGTHPQQLNNAVPGETVTFTIQVTGREPLSYQWQHNMGDGNREWQSCDVEKFAGANSSTLTIPSVQKSDEGSYRCTVSNCGGSETSECATLTLGEPPQITTHPQELKCTISGSPVSFTVQAGGTQPLSYQWQWKPVVEGVSSEEWQNLSSGGSVQGVETATLTFTSIESCSEGLYRCVVTNVVGEDISEYTEHIIGKVRELRVLVNELNTVTQWYLLGIYLGLHPSALDAIKKNCTDIKECCTHMLIEWQKRVIPTWSAVVKALVGIGRERLASHLAAKYGIALPNRIDNKPLEELEITEVKMAAAAESTEAQYHKDEFQQLGRRLSDIEKLLKTSRDSQVPLNKNVSNLVSELTKVGEEVQKLAQEKENTTLELQRKQQDIQLLSEMQKDLTHSAEKFQMLQEKCQLLQEIISDKKREITKLETKLRKKECKLQSLQQEAKKMKDKLSKLQAELEEKHEQIKTLQKEKEELTRTYNAEKEDAKKLLLITLSDRDELKKQLITTEEELQHKSQQIASYNIHISQLTEEVETLSSSLQEKEAAVSQLESEYQSYQKAATLIHMSDIIILTTETAQLKQRLQEAEFQKQQVTLEKDAALQEVEAKKEVEMQLHRHLDEPPKVNDHPKSLKVAVLDVPVTFSIQASGSKPLNYQWQHKTRDGSGGWLLCDVKSFPGANSSTLTISSAQKSNEGSYCCTVSNLAGSETSECATLTLAEPPRITTHPQEVKDVVPGKLVTFSIVATGTEPLSYQWQYEAESEGLQLYDVEKSPGANSSTLTIPRVKRLNEGSYYCIVSNCSGSETSKCAALSLAEPPRITAHPKDFKLEDTVIGQQVLFTVQATGTKPLNYQWQYNPDMEGWSEEWQPCSGSNTATLTIPSMQKSNKGSYRCVVSNCAGSRTSKAVKLFDLAEPPRIITHPKDSTYTLPGQQVTFTVQAAGTKPMSYHWQWNPDKEGVSEDWPSWSGADTPTLTVQNVQKSNEGSYRCVISNCVGSQTSKAAKLERHLLSELTWRRLPDMPGVMWRPQSVTVDTVVYIADRNWLNGVILRYDLHSQQWMEPLQYQYCACGMTTLSSQLVMVGGVDVFTHKTTNRVGVYSPSQRSWTHPYPPLKTPRYWPAVSTYHQRLVVAGGCGSGTILATVEIMDISVSHCQWLSATGLPVSCSLMSAAITDGTLYLLGGLLDKKVFSVSLSAFDKPPAQWRALPDTPLGHSTAIAVHGSLLAVGGSHGRQRSSAIHVYNQEKNEWNKVGDLPAEREYCACCLLPSGEILVAGGEDRNGWRSRMDVAAAKD